MKNSSGILDAALSRYGQKFPTETPELLTSALKELDDELAKVPTNKNKWYATAIERAPDLCDVKFKLKHLRCEVFNVEVRSPPCS